MFVELVLRHSFTTRLLYSVMPSTWYAKHDASIDALHQIMADDFFELFHHGISVEATHAKKIYVKKIHMMFFEKNPYDVLYRISPRYIYRDPLIITNPQVGGKTVKVYGVYTGAKGDWPWVRKAFHLSSGFTSLRKCHLCPSQVLC